MPSSQSNVRQSKYRAHQQRGSMPINFRRRPFRATIGQGNSERDQAKRQVQRVIDREAAPGVFGASVLKALRYQLFAATPLEVFRAGIDELMLENRRLRTEIAEFRPLLGKTRTSNPEPASQWQSHLRAASELIALVSDKEAILLDELLTEGRIAVRELVCQLEIESALRFCNLLGRSRVANLTDDEVRLTEFGSEISKLVHLAASSESRDAG